MQSSPPLISGWVQCAGVVSWNAEVLVLSPVSALVLVQSCALLPSFWVPLSKAGSDPSTDDFKAGSVLLCCCWCIFGSSGSLEMCGHASIIVSSLVSSFCFAIVWLTSYQPYRLYTLLLYLFLFLSLLIYFFFFAVQKKKMS